MKPQKKSTAPAEAARESMPRTGIFVFRVSSENRGAALRVFLTGVVALALFGFVINSYVGLNEVYSQISEANTQLNLLRSDNIRMQTELEGKASISNIKDYAEEELGLQVLDKSQITYVELQKQDVVEIEEQEQNIFARIGKWFNHLLTYLRG